MTDEELNIASKSLSNYINARFKTGICIVGVGTDKLCLMVQHDLLSGGERKLMEKTVKEWTIKNPSVKLDIRHVGKIVLAKGNK